MNKLLLFFGILLLSACEQKTSTDKAKADFERDQARVTAPYDGPPVSFDGPAMGVRNKKSSNPQEK